MSRHRELSARWIACYIPDSTGESVRGLKVLALAAADERTPEADRPRYYRRDGSTAFFSFPYSFLFAAMKNFISLSYSGAAR